MPASRSSRASHKSTDEETLKQVAPENDQTPNVANQAGEVPSLPDLTGTPVAPEAWLSLQQSIGNSAVGGLLERRRAGQALPPDVRHDMEASFGQNFGQVQVHSGQEVDQAAQALGAAAFTAGNDIYVHSAVPGFDDPRGRQVLSEEVAHVAQGVGREGPSRVTTPGGTTEREAHRAATAAAGGRGAQVSAAPEAAGAVARFGMDELEELAKKKLGLGADNSSGAESAVAEIGAAIAEAAEQAPAPAELSDEDKDRLDAGAVQPLTLLWTQLGDKQMSAPDGKPAAQDLLPLIDNSGGIGDFIMNFAGLPGIRDSLEQAAVGARSGHNALLAAVEPQKGLMATAERLANAGAWFSNLPPGETATTGDTGSELSPADAAELHSGVGEPLTSMSAQLQSDKPDLELIIGRLRSIPKLLRSFSKPDKLVPQFRSQAMMIETQIQTLEAIRGGVKAAVSEAMSNWQSAINLLRGLTIKAERQGGSKAGEGAAGRDDSGTNNQRPAVVTTKAGGI